MKIVKRTLLAHGRFATAALILLVVTSAGCTTDEARDAEIIQNFPSKQRLFRWPTRKRWRARSLQHSPVLTNRPSRISTNSIT